MPSDMKTDLVALCCEMQTEKMYGAKSNRHAWQQNKRIEATSLLTNERLMRVEGIGRWQIIKFRKINGIVWFVLFVSSDSTLRELHVYHSTFISISCSFLFATDPLLPCASQSDKRAKITSQKPFPWQCCWLSSGWHCLCTILLVYFLFYSVKRKPDMRKPCIVV